MSRFDVILDTKRLEAKLTKLEKQALPAATVRAINNSAFQARQTTQKLLSLELDRPTPFITRGVLVTKATPQTRVGEVYVRKEASASRSPSDYLLHHERGGQRFRKRSETLLEKRGLLGRNESIVPGSGIRLNAYGNIPGSRMVAILSQVKAFEEVGFKANVTKRSAKRNPRRKQYFSPRPGSKLPRGIYERYGKGKAKPVLLFVPLAQYKKRTNITSAVRQDVNRRFPEEFRRALAFEVRRLR